MALSNFEPSLKIAVFGGSGTGKTSLATELGRILGIQPIHIDDLYWQKNWQEKEIQDLRSEISHLVKNKHWIVDGNYSSVRDLVLQKANLAIILRPPLYVTLWRLWWRTFFRWMGLKPEATTRRPQNVIRINPPEGLFRSFLILAESAFKHYTYKSRGVHAEAKLEGVRTVVIANSSQYGELLENIKNYAREKSES